MADSDSDSLPDLSKICKPVPKNYMSRGDIVWAKFKNLYWPALVRAIYPKQKKISIWYSDEPGKTFKLPLKNVALFNDAAIRAKIRQDALEAGCFKELDGLTSHANRYLIRKSQGYDDDPKKFFDQTYPFFLVEEMKKREPDSEISDMTIPPMYISNEKKQSIRKALSLKKNISDDSEVESADSNDEQEEKEVKEYEIKVEEFLKVGEPAPFKSELVEEIVECILAGNADDHLKKVLSKQVPSQHRDIYEESQTCSKKTLISISYTGPVEDDDKLRKLIFYLLPFYDRVNGEISGTKKGGPVKCKQISLSSPSMKSVHADYVSKVFLPESIIYAISVIGNITYSEAKELFLKYEVKSKALQNILSSLDSDKDGKDELPSASTSSKMGDVAAQVCDDTETGSLLKKRCLNMPGKNVAKKSFSKDVKFPGTNSKLSDEAGSSGMDSSTKCISSGEDNGTSDNTVKHIIVSIEKSKYKDDI